MPQRCAGVPCFSRGVQSPFFPVRPLPSPTKLLTTPNSTFFFCVCSRKPRPAEQGPPPLCWPPFLSFPFLRTPSFFATAGSPSLVKILSLNDNKERAFCLLMAFLRIPTSRRRCSCDFKPQCALFPSRLPGEGPHAPETSSSSA